MKKKTSRPDPIEETLSEPRNYDPLAETVAEIIDSLDFSPEDVVEVSAKTASLFMKAGEYRIERLRQHSAAELHTKETTASRQLEIRAEARELGEKLTEENIKAKVILDDAVHEANLAENAAEAHDEYAKLLVEAIRVRRDCLQIVGGITGREIAYSKAAEAASEKMAETRASLRKKYPGE